MTTGDIIGLVVSYIYAFGMLFGVEAIGKALKWQQPFTRKIIHIGAGLWIWGILALFDNWYYGIIPFATFIVMNFVFYRFKIFQSMDAVDSSPGTIYFAISITILFGLLWRTGGDPDQGALAAGAVMAMTLGDAMASIVGRRWGKHEYKTFGHTRSYEGSAAMAVFSAIGIGAGLYGVLLLGLSDNPVLYGDGRAIIMIVVGTIIATLAEAFSPAGTDNLSVPLLAGVVMWLVGMVG